MGKLLGLALGAAALFSFSGCCCKTPYTAPHANHTNCIYHNNQIDCNNATTNYFYTKERLQDFPVTYKKAYIQECVVYRSCEPCHNCAHHPRHCKCEQ